MQYIPPEDVHDTMTPLTDQLINLGLWFVNSPWTIVIILIIVLYLAYRLTRQ
jgi:type II secretory pathway component PulF